MDEGKRHAVWLRDGQFTFFSKSMCVPCDKRLYIGKRPTYVIEKRVYRTV